MDTTAAKKLVRETLEASFDKERFRYFVRNILGQFDESKAFHARGHVKEKFRTTIPVIKTYERLGTYTDPDDKRIDLLVVYLQKEKSIERERTSLRNFVADYLKCRDEKDAALVAFVAPNRKDWRFSFVRMEYRFGEQGKVEEEFTPARRYSFLVGENEHSHTAQSSLLSLLESDTWLQLDELEKAFGVERVTKEFFEKYKELFLRLKEALDSIAEKDAKIKKDFERNKVNTIDFAKKLMGQIVFLYFLQKKGWFGVARGKEWGDGDKKFLRRLFSRSQEEGKNYFNRFLEPLFYEALRLERPEDYYDRFECRIPFLNGGLFDPINNYDWQDTDIEVLNELFSNNKQTKEGDTGDGILDVFDRYNFTVKEDEPLEKEVAVDPEMLGKVFESLLDVKDRKSTGTFYTPREIVHYMCRESLINVLHTNLDGIIPIDDLEAFINHGDAFVEHEEARIEKIANKKAGNADYSGSYKRRKLPANIEKSAERIDNKLASMCICDPAVGSGAFVVGMMNEIVRARNALTPYMQSKDARTPYDFKRKAIQNCLYGVDIETGAVEIAKLRLWLSLVVDEEDRETIKPLPNLDYKIVQGNSLLGYPSGYRSERLRRINDLQNQYHNEHTPHKDRLKGEIDALIKKALTHSKSTLGYELDFDFNIFFSEVFRKKKGFDVVIGNPPYIQLQNNGGELANRYKNKGFTTFARSGDIYCLFYERGLRLLMDSGHLCYITSNKWMRAKYGTKLRSLFLKHGIKTLVDLGPNVFETATVDTNILLISKGTNTHQGIALKLTRHENSPIGTRGMDISDRVNKEGVSLAYIKSGGKPWFIGSQAEVKLKEKIERVGTPLKEWDIAIYRGLLTGRNEAFIIDSETKQALVREDPSSDEILKPILRGKDIKRYRAEWAGLWVIDTHNGYGDVPPVDIEDYPVIKRHLDSFYPRLEKRQDKGITPYNLRSCAYYKEFAKDKIVWSEIVRKPQFFYDTEKLYVEATGFLMIGESLKYLCGLLNSKPVAFFFRKFYSGGGLGEEGYRYKKAFLNNLPVPAITESNGKLADTIEKLADEMLIARKNEINANTSVVEDKIRQVVYQLYDLGEKEIQLIESNGSS